MEGLPVALVEAVACGVPVVTTRLSGIPELVEGVGVLVEPGSVESLRSALENVLAGQASFSLDEGRKRVERDFDARRSARRVAELWRSSRAERPRKGQPSGRARLGGP